MAQETRVAPIQLNDTNTKILMDLGDSMQKQNMQQKQLDYENRKLGYEQAKEQQKAALQHINQTQEKIVSIGAKPEDTNAALQIIKDETSKVLNSKNVDYTGIYGRVNQGLQTLVQSNGIKNGVDKQADEAAKANPDINLNQLKTHLSSTVYPNGVGGIDINNNNYAAKALDPTSNPQFYKLYDPTKSQATTLKMLTDNKDKQTYSSETGGQVGLVRTVKGDKVSFDPTFYQLDGKGGVKMLTDGHGMLSDKPYQELTANSSANAYLSQRAQQFIDHYNAAGASERAKWMTDNGITEDELLSSGQATKTLDPNNPAIFETLKRAFATDAVQRHSPVSVNGKDVTTVVNNNGGNGQNQVDNENLPVHPWDRIQEIVKGNKDFIKESYTAKNDKTSHDVTDQFAAFKIADDDANDPTLPDKVLFNNGRFHVYLKGREMAHSYSPAAFNDLINTRTPGVNYQKPKNTFKKITHSNGSTSDGLPDASSVN